LTPSYWKGYLYQCQTKLAIGQRSLALECSLNPKVFGQQDFSFSTKFRLFTRQVICCRPQARNPSNERYKELEKQFPADKHVSDRVVTAVLGPHLDSQVAASDQRWLIVLVSAARFNARRQPVHRFDYHHGGS
jgi:hypothetical protein